MTPRPVYDFNSVAYACVITLELAHAPPTSSQVALTLLGQRGRTAHRDATSRASDAHHRDRLRRYSDAARPALFPLMSRAPLSSPGGTLAGECNPHVLSPLSPLPPTCAVSLPRSAPRAFRPRAVPGVRAPAPGKPGRLPGPPAAQRGARARRAVLCRPSTGGIPFTTRGAPRHARAVTSR